MNQRMVWNKIAGGWANVRWRIFPEIIEFAHGKKGKILEIGCGNGKNLKEFHGKRYGIDFSEKMADEAKKFSDKHFLSVNITVAHADELPFKNNSFDVILCTAVIHSLGVKKRLRCIKELRRVLKPGKTALISVWHRKPGDAFLPWIKRHEVVYRYYHFFKEKELRKIIRKSGLKIKKLWISGEKEKNIWIIVEKHKRKNISKTIIKRRKKAIKKMKSRIKRKTIKKIIHIKRKITKTRKHAKKKQKTKIKKIIPDIVRKKRIRKVLRRKIINRRKNVKKVLKTKRKLKKIIRKYTVKRKSKTVRKIKKIKFIYKH